MKKSSDFLSLAGKTVLITGATRGIGKAICDLFLDKGAKIIATGTDYKQIDSLNELVHHKNLTYVQADFSDDFSFKKFIDFVSKTSIDICINNAGINIIKSIDKVSQLEYLKIMKVNADAPYFISKEVSKSMKKRQSGRIINISSIWSVISKEKRSLYTMSKHGLVGLTKCLAVELAEHNILVNSISPGFTNTELTKKSLSKDDYKSLTESVPLQRFANTDEIANVALFLSSEMNTYITGQNIIVDGGYTNV